MKSFTMLLSFTMFVPSMYANRPVPNRSVLHRSVLHRSVGEITTGGKLIVDGVVDAFQSTFGLSREGSTKEISKLVIVLGIFALIDVMRGYSIIRLLKDTGDLAKDAAFIAILTQLLERLGKGKVAKREKKKSDKFFFSPFVRTIIAYKAFCEYRRLSELSPESSIDILSEVPPVDAPAVA